MALQFLEKYQLSSSVHEDSITCVAFSIKGVYIASGGRTLRIFSLDDGKLHYSIITTSSVKSLVWLPGPEQTLLCAYQSGILMNITIRPGVCSHIYSYMLRSHISYTMKDTINISYFQEKHHFIDFMAVDISAAYLATGHGEDVRIWKGDKHCTSSTPCQCFSLLVDLHMHMPQMIGKGRAL